MKLTILFNGQFWEGVVESQQDGCLKAGRHIFGSEPKDSEVFDFVNHLALKLLERASASKVEVSVVEQQKVSPKRLAREVAKEMSVRGISTKAQEAIQQELELQKQEKKMQSKAEKEAEKEQKRLNARHKAKERHRGRA
ncbi:MAG: YjdF family protein [Chroococcidiopsidaceae cyanobacterium CP_BM_ER_R8_30]|nr:YjdF family protein [Chroococcidiopsidaceae cyanobacterium CP_BM_ER_R8_30]